MLLGKQKDNALWQIEKGGRSIFFKILLQPLDIIDKKIFFRPSFGAIGTYVKVFGVDSNF